MKKLLLSTTLLLCATLATQAQVLNETFSASFPPTDWTRFLNNSANIPSLNNWTSVTVSFPPAPTDYAAYASGQGPGSVNVSEKYLVTPKLKPAAGSSTLSFKLKREGTPVPLYANYLVKVSTASNNTASDFTTVATFVEGFTSNVTTTFQNFTVDLSAYNNQDIYVAFVWSGNGDNGCYLDDVTGVPLSGGIFPLQITSFSANARKSEVVLQWTATNAGEDHPIDVERSSNGAQWNKLTTLNGRDNISSFVDRTPLAGRNYYLLAQKEADGKPIYSIVRTVMIGNGGQAGSIYPNPVVNQLNIDLGYIPAGKIVYTITDAQGKGVMTGTITNKQTSIATNRLTRGNYIVRLSDGQVFNCIRE